MAFIEELDKKRKWDTYLTIGAIAGSLLFCAIVVVKVLSFAQNERQKIYVLSNDIPISAEQTNEEMTLEIEAKAQINLFHQLFFTLAPDDKYIHYNLERGTPCKKKVFTTILSPLQRSSLSLRTALNSMKKRCFLHTMADSG